MVANLSEFIWKRTPVVLKTRIFPCEFRVLLAAFQWCNRMLCHSRIFCGCFSAKFQWCLLVFSQCSRTVFNLFFPYPCLLFIWAVLPWVSVLRRRQLEFSCLCYRQSSLQKCQQTFKSGFSSKICKWLHQTRIHTHTHMFLWIQHKSSLISGILLYLDIILLYLGSLNNDVCISGWVRSNQKIQKANWYK